MSDVTQILMAIDNGDPRAAEQLLPLVYDELRKLAAQRLAQEKPGQTLQATALVHEAYLRLAPIRDESPSSETRWNSRGHFFAAAAEAMRRILVESARRKGSLKRGVDQQRVSLDQAISLSEPPSDDLLALNEALNRLAQEDPIKADLVKLRYFAGLSVEQTAEALGISRATADRYWSYAKVWLYQAVTGEDEPTLG